MKKRSKFTLVEVVVAGALLSALLLPALHRARERARQSNCKSNLKQIGTALSVYTNSDILKDYPIYVCPPDKPGKKSADPKQRTPGKKNDNILFLDGSGKGGE